MAQEVKSVSTEKHPYRCSVCAAPAFVKSFEGDYLCLGHYHQRAAERLRAKK